MASKLPRFSQVRTKGFGQQMLQGKTRQPIINLERSPANIDEATGVFLE